MFSADLKSKTP